MSIDPASIFSLASAALVTAAVFSWLNHRFVGLPTTIGVMLIALGMSLALHGLAVVGFDVDSELKGRDRTFEVPDYPSPGLFRRRDK